MKCYSCGEEINETELNCVGHFILIRKYVSTSGLEEDRIKRVYCGPSCLVSGAKRFEIVNPKKH